MSWKHPEGDTASTVLRNWLNRVMGPNWVADGESPDPDPAAYPHYYTRHDQPHNPKGR